MAITGNTILLIEKGSGTTIPTLARDSVTIPVEAEFKIAWTFEVAQEIGSLGQMAETDLVLDSGREVAIDLVLDSGRAVAIGLERVSGPEVVIDLVPASGPVVNGQVPGNDLPVRGAAA